MLFSTPTIYSQSQNFFVEFRWNNLAMGPPEIIVRSFRNVKRFSKPWAILRKNRWAFICVRLTLIKHCVTCLCFASVSYGIATSQRFIVFITFHAI